MKNIFLLPTDKPTYLYEMEGKLHLSDKFEKGNKFWHNQHIHITSDEEIKEVNYFIFEGKVFKAIKIGYECIWYDLKENGINPDYCKKIILTTDQDLIKDGVQPIPDEFLEWFVKNPSCEEVEVIKGSFDLNPTETTLLRENYIPENTFDTYKITIPKEESKQETLEEAINNEINNIDINSSNLENIAKYNRISGTLLSELKKSMSNIAKWQQEQDKNKYSEEDMEEYSEYVSLVGTPKSPKEWFLKFKKK